MSPAHARATAWICVTCGVQQTPAAEPPEHCPVCDDERQYVGHDGQQWTTREQLAAERRTVLREEEPGLLGVGVEPALAIGQRALLVQTPGGNVLWDCVSLLDDAALAQVQALGGVAAVAISHPHFHGACVDVAEALDAPVLVPRADAGWVQRPSGRVVLFDDVAEPVPGVTVHAVGGHFPGASVLHWPAGADGRGVLLTSDTVMVVPDRRWVSFMWSYPNLLPLDAATVQALAARLEPLAFERLWSGWWGRCVERDAAAVVQRSARRYVARLAGERPGQAPGESQG